MGDGSKYLEGNYSISNPFTAVGEMFEDLKQAQELENLEDNMTAYMQYLKDMREEHHYLVDGAILRCTNCTMEPQTPLKEVFEAPEGSNEVILKVTQNSTAKNGAEQCFATIKDSKKFYNVVPFGNCLNPPDREKEKKALELAEQSEELRKLGTCRYMMELNDEWDNMIADNGYEKVPEEDGKPLETITMESILFCRHGGFIYPVNSGYIMTENGLALPDPSDPQAVKEYMWKFFINAGFSEYAVAGILGNVYVETGGTFDPTIISKAGYYGLFQWGGNRKQELIDRGIEWAKQNGWAEHDWENGWKQIEIQCQFALDEYNHETESNEGWFANKLDVNGTIVIGTQENFENAQSTTEAALIWALSFERCIVDESKYKGEDGNTYYTQLQGQNERVDEAEKCLIQYGE